MNGWLRQKKIIKAYAAYKYIRLNIKLILKMFNQNKIIIIHNMESKSGAWFVKSDQFKTAVRLLL